MQKMKMGGHHCTLQPGQATQTLSNNKKNASVQKQNANDRSQNRKTLNVKKKWKRLLLLSSSLLAFLVFILLILFSLSDSISFFYSPTQALEIGTTQKEIRLGGF